MSALGQLQPAAMLSPWRLRPTRFGRGRDVSGNIDIRMNQSERIRRVIERLENHFRKVTINAPAPADSAARVGEKFSHAPDELLHFLEICDGISVSVEDDVRGVLFSISESLERLAQPLDLDPEILGISEAEAERLEVKLAPDFEISKRLYPTRGDGCGNFDCVLMGPGTGAGSVVFWDTTSSFRPAYLLAGDFCAYLEHWSDSLVSRFFPDGSEDQRYVGPELDNAPWIGEPELSHPWPFDLSWLRKADSRAAPLLDDLSFRRDLLAQED